MSRAENAKAAEPDVPGGILRALLELCANSARVTSMPQQDAEEAMGKKRIGVIDQ